MMQKSNGIAPDGIGKNIMQTKECNKLWKNMEKIGKIQEIMEFLAWKNGNKRVIKMKKRLQ